MYKKGAIWISVVLYMGLGIIVLSMVLAVGLPTVQKMKDKYILTQTKDLMLALDGNIRTVYQEGPGSQRVIKLKIGKGEFKIDQDNEVISWILETSAVYTQPEIQIIEGSLQILTEETNVKGNYEISFTLDYDSAALALDLTYQTQQSIFGTSTLSILNKGINDQGKTEISVTKL